MARKRLGVEARGIGLRDLIIKHTDFNDIPSFCVANGLKTTSVLCGWFSADALIAFKKYGIDIRAIAEQKETEQKEKENKC
ncbi:hypothetical protein [Campylobacter hyointestinalis]|uniref:hypothetical protein n=1 Tax=Campylobacter hyointestinalis TaxID=198 RepID=UPI000CE4FE28|nr:hypothetical protein [Campylobacter hyointestinalis]PPB63111.1 hypothetical protein CDQ72_01565 [Campylobacter hyointestinalis subsp. hyointestinalis]PPB65381.1 hypothetical protein CDQ73_01315 [Campylobacter hyointestinalis subsp. hyointestinalis]